MTGFRRELYRAMTWEELRGLVDRQLGVCDISLQLELISRHCYGHWYIVNLKPRARRYVARKWKAGVDAENFLKGG